jgi:hypothetical protein
MQDLSDVRTPTAGQTSAESGIYVHLEAPNLGEPTNPLVPNNVEIDLFHLGSTYSIACMLTSLPSLIHLVERLSNILSSRETAF